MTHRNQSPVNEAVYSAAKRDGVNSRLILAEWRYKKFHIVVFFDYTDDCFHFCQTEHNKTIQHDKRQNSEIALLDKFLQATHVLTEQRINERRFERSRSVNQSWLPNGADVPNIRRHHPAKIGQRRSIIDTMPRFIPDEEQQ